MDCRTASLRSCGPALLPPLPPHPRKKSPLLLPLPLPAPRMFISPIMPIIQLAHGRFLFSYDSLLATPSVVAPSNTKVSSAPSSSGSAPAIVGAAGAEPGQGDGALSVKASGSIMALSALVAAFALL